MNEAVKRSICYRWFFYLSGLTILAFGLTLNTKADLGVSPILSLSYCVSELSEISLANTTFVMYCFFVIMQLALHCLEKKKSVILLQDILQLPLSLIFTRVMDIFVYWIPDFAEDFSGQFAGTTGFRIIILVVAIICTGIGTAMSINMRIVANPADGFVQALSDFTGKNAGLMKNCVDGFCLMIALCIGLAVAHQPVGIGIGTILAVFGTGRVVALFNYFCMRKMKRLAAVAE